MRCGSRNWVASSEKPGGSGGNDGRFGEEILFERPPVGHIDVRSDTQRGSEPQNTCLVEQINVGCAILDGRWRDGVVRELIPYCALGCVCAGRPNHQAWPGLQKQPIPVA